MSSRTWLRLVWLVGLLVVAAFVMPAWTQDEKGKKADNEPAKKITNSIGMKLVLIPAGKFLMGSPKDEIGRNNDEAQHRVEITKAFYLGMYEVTQKEYRTVMGKNPSYYSRDGAGKAKVKDVTEEDLAEFPVECVSWKDAQEFLEKLNNRPAEVRSRRKYRLPTEAEWEYACRGGTSSSKAFHFGDSLTSDQANFEDTNLGRPCKVGSYKANGFGLHDMHGNVYEWCADRYDQHYYAKSLLKDPSGPSSGSGRVSRGGSWNYNAGNCRSPFRDRFAMETRNEYLGFRVALVPAGE
jgi:sulfatase modifying factor 1